MGLFCEEVWDVGCEMCEDSCEHEVVGGSAFVTPPDTAAARVNSPNAPDGIAPPPLSQGFFTQDSQHLHLLNPGSGAQCEGAFHAAATF